ncbi:MAG: helix-turn-helix domain-containing protein, partial [Telmatospirillum sp.]|nr:helix-turn-helix domain-containing protein [Telmatospirillum sp.]
PPPAAGRPAVVILPPSLEGVPAPALIRAVAPWLVARHDEGAILASVCAGAFLLAGTGLLDGRPATTHWRHAPVLSARFPGVLVVADRLIVDDGDVVTAGGVMAWTDLGLTLVARFLGPAVMLETARLLVIDPPGRDQRSYRHFVAPRDHGDAAILAAQHRLEDWSAAVPSIALLARIAGLGDRTFLRRFQRATGLSPRDYSQNVRIGRARTLLELGRDPVDAVAWQVGYQDPAAFRKIFRRITGLGPADYRRRFGVAPAPPGEGT